MDIRSISLNNVVPLALADSRATATSMIWNTDFTFEAGKIYMVESASGTGKSSLCSYVFGLRGDYSGSISFNDTNIRSLSQKQWSSVRSRSISLLPQEMRIFPELTALENIQLKNSLTNHLSPGEITDMMQTLGIAEKKDVPCSRLSIGQQQRVALIRALCQPFSFLFLDEPVSHLDESNNRTAASLVLDHARRQQAAIVCTSVGNPLLLDSPHIIRLSL